MKKTKFFILAETQGKVGFTEAVGEKVIVPGFEKFDFFIRKVRSRQWEITEGRTGLRMISAASKNCACVFLEYALKNEREIERSIEKSESRYGLSPLYKKGDKENGTAAEIPV